MRFLRTHDFSFLTSLGIPHQRAYGGVAMDPSSPIKESILGAVGDTPLVRLSRLGAGLAPALVAKIEALNPGGSIKDRVAIALIEAAERDGQLASGRHDHRADQRQHRHRARDGGIAQGLPRDRGHARQDVQGEDRPAARVRRRGRRRAHRGAARLARVVLPRGRSADRGDPRRVPAQPVPQPANPEAHYLTTGPELWRQSGGQITHLVAGVGPAARSPASGATCASRTRTSRSSAPTRSARSSRAARTR